MEVRAVSRHSRWGMREGNDVTLLSWTLPMLRPYQARVALIAVLALIEIGLSALAPWPLKVVVDNVLGGQPMPAPLAAFFQSLVGSSIVGLLLIVVLAGLLLQVASEVVVMIYTQIQVATAQHLVYDLRTKL